MKKSIGILTLIVVLSLAVQTAASAKMAFRMGLGTDLSGGLAIGLNGSWIRIDQSYLERDQPD